MLQNYIRNKCLLIIFSVLLTNHKWLWRGFRNNSILWWYFFLWSTTHPCRLHLLQATCLQDFMQIFVQVSLSVPRKHILNIFEAIKMFYVSIRHEQLIVYMVSLHLSLCKCLTASTPVCDWIYQSCSRNTEETFLQDFVVILNRMHEWVMDKWLLNFCYKNPPVS